MLIKLECRNVSYQCVIFFWSIEPEVNERIYEFGYIVEVTESLEGPWIPLYDTPIYAFGYADYKTQRGMSDQRLHYRVRSINQQGVEYISNSVCLFSEEMDRISSYIAEQHNFMLRRFEGYDFLHYARKKFGERCPHCYDEIARKSIRSKCPMCYGTTYKNGYFAPVKILVKLNPTNKGTEKNDYGVNEQLTSTGWVSNEAIVEADDILVSLEKPLERYSILSIVPTGLHNSVTRQEISMSQLKMDHPAQMLSVDPDAYTLREFSIFRRDW